MNREFSEGTYVVFYGLRVVDAMDSFTAHHSPLLETESLWDRSKYLCDVCQQEIDNYFGLNATKPGFRDSSSDYKTFRHVFMISSFFTG